MPENLKRIYVPNDNMEADLIKDTLEQNGIYCFIQGYEHRSMLGVLGSYVELGIMVPEDQSEEASEIVKELLETIQVLPPEFEDEDEKEAYKPPKKFRPKNKRIAVFLSFAIPGTGSCYAGNSKSGSLIVVVYLACLAIYILSTSSNLSYLFNFSSMSIAFIITIIVVLIPLDIIIALKSISTKSKKKEQ